MLAPTSKTTSPGSTHNRRASTYRASYALAPRAITPRWCRSLTHRYDPASTCRTRSAMLGTNRRTLLAVEDITGSSSGVSVHEASLVHDRVHQEPIPERLKEVKDQTFRTIEETEADDVTVDEV